MRTKAWTSNRVGELMMLPGVIDVKRVKGMMDPDQIWSEARKQVFIGRAGS